MKISIIGGGYVGLVTGLCLAEKGHHITCVEVSREKLHLLRAGRPPFFEPGLAELLSAHAGHRFQATDSLQAAVQQTELTLVAVGTPFDGNQIDLSFVKEVSQQLGQALADKPDYHVVVVKSTVVPGTTDSVVVPMLADASGKVAGREFGVGTNPEFLSEGTAIDDFLEPDRIVIGGIDDRTRHSIANMYREFGDVPRIETSNKAAEMIKYASNSLLATLISFSNEIGNLCSALGDVDVVDVMRGVHWSQYLSPRQRDGTRQTAPIASFLDAGCGFGGSCLPKDVAALLRHGQDYGESMPLLASVLATNHGQPGRMLELLRRHFAPLTGATVTVLGLAFKPDTDDVRQSPSLPLVRALVDEGCRVKAFDPVANSSFAEAIGPLPVEYSASLEDSLADTQAVLLVTRWQEFARVPSLLRPRADDVVVIDGRRMISPESVRRYEGIGLRHTSDVRVNCTASETSEVS